MLAGNGSGGKRKAEVEMDETVLKQRLEQVDGRGYKAYLQIKGSYEFTGFKLFIDHVQSDPFAAPSRMRVRVPQQRALFEPELSSSHERRTALEDYLARSFARAVRKHVKGNRGTGKSGFVGIDSGGQEIIERTAAVVNEEWIEARFVVGLPADGRRCRGGEAAAIFFQELPQVVETSLLMASNDKGEIYRHVEVAEDQEWLRGQLAGLGLVAFVEDGAILPRKSGISDSPLGSGEVRFKSPAELRQEVPLPNRGPVAGMGIPVGVTLIVGGGYHGKSTLLRAIERGVYDHVPGDGREGVVSRDDAVKIRAEDGRRIEQVDISPFISNLPFGVDTGDFTTENASGSTSQAANIMEALEAGTSLLVLDEDTSATNFMIRDDMMQRLIAKDKEPITPFVDRVRPLYDDLGVSTILVMGGSGDYFEVADTVIAMENYEPRLATDQARRIAATHGGARLKENSGGFGSLRPRAPLPDSINPRRGKRERVSIRGLNQLVFGREIVDLSGVEQLVDTSQTMAIGDLVRYGLKQGYFDGEATLAAILDNLQADVAQLGLDIISPFIDAGNRGAGEKAGSAGPLDSRTHPGEYAMPRRYEIAAMLNRMRSLRVKQQ
jgi:predicted ABC-class ATPase